MKCFCPMVLEAIAGYAGELKCTAVMIFIHMWGLVSLCDS